MPRAVLEIEQAAGFAENSALRAGGEMRDGVRWSGKLHGEGRTSERSAERDSVTGAFDAGEFSRSPVTGDFAEFHPEQIVEARVQAADDFLPDFESELLAVPPDAGPMREGESGFAALNDIHHAAALQIFGDEFVHAAGRGVVPAARPIARAADDADDTARVRTIESAGIFDAWRDALRAFAVEMAEVVRNLGAKNIANGLERGLGELRQSLVAEAAGRGD